LACLGPTASRRTRQAGDHAVRMARFALAALRAAAATLVDPADPGRGAVRLRVGLHSGPCSAGVVGRSRPKYTLFGDTINVAARMEQGGLPGRAQCTVATASMVRAQDPEGRVGLEPRGAPVEVKGKGTMDTFWIVEGCGCEGGEGGRGETSVRSALPAGGGGAARVAAAGDGDA
jgi:class 3 adenylate cyclase